MAVIDDLVSSGLSLTQAQAVQAVGAGSGTEADLVSQGFSSTQATAIVTGGDVDELVRQGLFGTQATAVNEAVGGGGGSATTYVSGANYSTSYFNGMGTSGALIVQGMDGTMTSAFSSLVVGSPISAVYGTGMASLIVTGAPEFQGPSSGDWAIPVTSDVGLMGNMFDSLVF